MQTKGSTGPAAGLLAVLGSHSSAGREPHSSTVLGGPFMEGAGRFWTLLQQCWPRWGSHPFERLVPEAWGPAVTPVMSGGAIGLTHRKAQRMGSEPFQFTDAPFHLGAEGQKKS